MSFSDLSLKPESSVRYQVDNLRSVCGKIQDYFGGPYRISKGIGED